jgi:hypothetical protein
MSTEPPRERPQSTVQAAGQAASDVVAGLKSSPAMLALVVLQIVVLGAILYGGTVRQRATSEQFAKVYELLEKCMNK